MSTILHHHPWPEAQNLAPLLARALPSTLTVYNQLLDLTNADLPLKIYATFPTDKYPEPVSADRGTSPPWVLLAESESQVRIFVSTEARAADASEEEIKLGEDAFVAAVRHWTQEVAPPEKEVLTLGAIHELWHKSIERLWSPITMGKYLVYLAPTNDAAKTVASAKSLPEGLEFRQVDESDIAEILTFSEVPHKPDYLKSRIAFTTAIYDTTSERCPLAAAVFTHPDGSIGTLHVHPSYRRRGLALAVVHERIRQDSSRRALAHVGETNKASRGLMVAMEWTICRETGKGGGEGGADLVAWARCPRTALVR